jgi:hypothetical protein
MDQASSGHRHGQDPDAVDEPLGGLPEAIAEVNAFRAAARKIVRNTGPRHLERTDQYRNVVLLAEKARRDALMPDVCQRAIWEECEGLLWERPPLDVPPDPVERRLLELVREGYVRCKECKRALPGPEEFAAWKARREARIRELELREKAVP